MSATRKFMNIEVVLPGWYSTTEISGLSGVGGPPGFMMIHELDSFTMQGFSSMTTVPPRTRE